MVRRRHELWLALGLVAAQGCFPAPVDVSGKRCAPERSCGEGFVCEDGRCVREGTRPPTNSIVNPGFEDGVEGWVATGALSAESPGFAGSRAARLELGGASEPVVLSPVAPPVRDALEDFYCATAWVKGSADLTATLELLQDGRADAAASLPLQATWNQVQVSTLFTGQQAATVRLTVSGGPGRTAWVDEVTLWRSADSLCEDSP